MGCMQGPALYPVMYCFFFDMTVWAFQHLSMLALLVGGFNPVETYYISQNGNLLQVGVKIENIFGNHPPVCVHSQHHLNQFD